MEIPEALFKELEVHALEGHPAEVCGFLLGLDGEVRQVLRVKRGDNLLAGSTNDRYLVDPKDTLEADREARLEGLDILGFYHSHPDHPAAPSSYDRERAWPWYSYLILATTAHRVQDAKAWRLEGDEMKEEPLKLMRSKVVEGV